IDIPKIANAVDVVFTATPSGVSSALVDQLMEHDVKIIDLSGDYRIKDQEIYKEWYKKEPANHDNIQKAIYGLTECLETDLQDVQLLSNPGCYPTAVLLGLAPLLQKQIINPTSIIIDAKSGVSGAGRNASPIAHFPEMNDNLKIYKVNAHQHIPEIEQVLNDWDSNVGTISFNTHLVPMTRGIMATMYVEATEDVTEVSLCVEFNGTFNMYYIVRINYIDCFRNTRKIYASNFCDNGLSNDELTYRIVIVAVIHNVMKGAAGQAVQNMHKMFGLDEK